MEVTTDDIMQAIDVAGFPQHLEEWRPKRAIGRPRSPIHNCLRAWLAGGEVESREIKRRAAALGMSKRTVIRAARQAGIVIRHSNHTTLWSLGV